MRTGYLCPCSLTPYGSEPPCLTLHRTLLQVASSCPPSAHSPLTATSACCRMQLACHQSHETLDLVPEGSTAWRDILALPVTRRDAGWFVLQAENEGPAMTDVALVCEDHDPLDGSVHGLLMCSKDVFDRCSAERLAGNIQVPCCYFATQHRPARSSLLLVRRKGKMLHWKCVQLRRCEVCRDHGLLALQPGWTLLSDGTATQTHADGSFLGPK